MSKKIGEFVTLSVRVLSVHPQGFRYGLEIDGSPKLPPHVPGQPPPTADEIAEAKRERPDTLEVELTEANGETLRVFVRDPG